LYNSGARADEAAKLTIDSLQLGAQSFVLLHGKGNKFRTCPLWPVTATSLSRLIVNRGKSDAVFLNRSNQPLTRFGIHRLVTQYAERASRTVPSMATKRVSPHTIRHTTVKSLPSATPVSRPIATPSRRKESWVIEAQHRDENAPPLSRRREGVA
jgi:site-specific recombinase XerD